MKPNTWNMTILNLMMEEGYLKIYKIIVNLNLVILLMMIVFYKVLVFLSQIKIWRNQSVVIRNLTLNLSKRMILAIKLKKFLWKYKMLLVLLPLPRLPSLYKDQAMKILCVNTDKIE